MGQFVYGAFKIIFTFAPNFKIPRIYDAQSGQEALPVALVACIDRVVMETSSAWQLRQFQFALVRSFK